MAWPTYEHKSSVPLAPAMIEIVRNLLPEVKVEMLVTNDKVAKQVRTLFPSPNFNIRKLTYSEIWMRDFGPSFFTKGSQKSILDYGFNYWGYEKPDSESSKLHEEVDRSIAKQLNVPTRRAFLIGEGGNRESNGAGVAMLVESVERQRNPKLNLELLTERHQKALGVSKVIWLKEGLVEDGYSFDGPVEKDIYLPITTGGHIDNIARFVNERTILLAEVTADEAKRSPLAAENRRRLEENLQILKQATDAEGRSFEIVRMPAADLQFETITPGDPVYDFLARLSYTDGSVFPKGKPVKVAHAASYMNFLIANGVVLTSKLYRPGAPEPLKLKDQQSVDILKKIFPNRKIVAIDTRAINLGGGGIHCLTSHEPK
jgi:agmatine deiminase